MASALVATLLGGTAGHVARHEVTEGRVAALQVVVAVLFGDIFALQRAFLQLLGIFQLLGNPDAAVVSQGLGHQRQLGLLVAVHGDAGRVNLHVGGVGEPSALAVAGHGSRAVAGHGVGGQEVGVAVSARGDDHGVGGETLQLARHQVLGDDAAGASVDDDHVLHLIAGEQLHRAGGHLAAQRGVSAQQQLLARLALGVECAGHLCATERTVGQRAAVFAGEGNALCHALVDDIIADFGQTVHICLAGAVVATLHGIVEQAVNRVTVVLVILGGIDTSLCGDGVCAARGVLNAEVENLETHFAQRGGCAGSSQARAHHDDVQAALVGGVNQFLMSFIVGPFLSYRTFRYS